MLTQSRRGAESAEEYAYQYEDIGNRLSSLDLTTNRTYTANSLNQYSAITTSDSGLQTSSFTPQFDDDGNQTLIQTSTGIWQVQYNGENRPILWTCIQPCNQLISNGQSVAMGFDRMGRRVIKNGLCFMYNEYQQIADNVGNIYAWDPVDTVTTCPLEWFSTNRVEYYVHDLDKNVSDVTTVNGTVAVHYEYAPFGVVNASGGENAKQNIWRFSSEFAENELGLVYYNFRHHIPGDGRWSSRDPEEETDCANVYGFLMNGMGIDALGLLKFQKDCNPDFISVCARETLEISEHLSKFLGRVKQEEKNDKSKRLLNRIYEAYTNEKNKNPDYRRMPNGWKNDRDIGQRINDIKKDLDTDRVIVTCCTETLSDYFIREKCKGLKDGEGAAATSGWGKNIPPAYRGKIIICPSGLRDMSPYGGCGCVLLHELIHLHGIHLEESEKSEYGTEGYKKKQKRNREKENGIVRITRILQERYKCNAYDTK